jgi:hypothetical protein
LVEIQRLAPCHTTSVQPPEVFPVTATDAPLAATPTTVEEVLGEVRTLTAEVTLAEPEAPVVAACAAPLEEDPPVAFR